MLLIKYLFLEKEYNEKHVKYSTEESLKFGLFGLKKGCKRIFFMTRNHKSLFGGRGG